ncbi:ABC-ATPase domain-containing protein [Thermocoleostomius sinensis]|uniref:ABC-ATPase domain-containing protein n=1 Tax=Thermocoleostomius sinensis A174 TaxID=2016057 RepID=A0A9E8ZDP2_9CYAN|nr:ABC-ATPase domain-containing protein [Thermocoleostomius sinensis]WAL59483.1 ABC-ATPase domain-containing protein [Thermocoleostomius sinensis A174]
MIKSQHLYQRLLDLDQCSYKAYKDIQGCYSFANFTLVIDHVQSDPFATPSRLRALVPQLKAQFPKLLYATHSREIALRDYLNRQFDRIASRLSDKRGSGKSGLIAIARPGQQVLERTAIFVDDQQIEARFVVGLPARGRTILGRQAAELLCEDLPEIVSRSLFYAALDASTVQQHVEVVEDAEWLRSQLRARGLVAFVPDGAILPRRSGVDDRPLSSQASSQEQAIAFRSPPSLRVEFARPNQGNITGMGVPQGITLVVGGGYHGKSTLLRAIALGIYNHIPGDGREQVVTDPAAVKIRAEDGRSITKVNLSPFINHLPQGRSTTQFSTENASGSTSQAATIIEALEAGATVLLVDEDTSATNFMIRDRRMQALIAKHQEPITPFIDKIRQLYQEYGVSTVLVMGGSGDYFDVADTVIAMTEFSPQDVTEQAKTIAHTYTTDRASEGGDRFGAICNRVLVPKRLDSPRSSDGRNPKLKVRDGDDLVFGTESIDVTAVEQLVDVGQLRSIGAAIHYLQAHYVNGRRSLSDSIAAVMADVNADGLDCLTPYPQGDLVAFRSLELAAVINRLRSLEVR